MDNPTVLTKFTKYYDTSFLLDGSKALKMSLPSEFNDVFDSQISLTKEKIKFLSKLYKMPEKLIKYYQDKLNNLVHIVSFTANSAENVNTSHMWGLYADNGKGLALEFDYGELDNHANGTAFNELHHQFKNYDIKNQDSMFTNEKILQDKANLLHNNPNGLKALQYCFSGLESLKSYSEPPYFKQLCMNLKNGIIETEHTELFIKFCECNPVNENRFLFKMSYKKNYSFILKAFEAYLQCEIKKIGGNINAELMLQHFKLYKIKCTAWEYEKEYRLITPYFTHDGYMKESANKSLESQQKILDDFKEKHKNSSLMYFYKYDSNNAWHAIDDNASGYGGVGVINLPLPQKIYLGWAFGSNKGAESKINEIKKFCKKYNVELFQLEQFFDYQTNSFITRQIY
jgi:hypothetical protein